MKPTLLCEGMVVATLVTPLGSGSVSQQVDGLEVLAGEGVRGDGHTGPTRLSDVRETVLKEIEVGKEVPIANTRQFSAISEKDLMAISGEMGVPGVIPYGMLGENLVISGIPNLTSLPPGALLTFSHGRNNRKAVLAVWGENLPCNGPGQNIVQHFSKPGQEPFKPDMSFPKAAIGKRGVVGFVYCSGKIKPGDVVRAWRP